MSGSTIARLAAQRRAGGSDTTAAKRAEHGSTIGRLLAAQEANAAQGDIDQGAQPVKAKRSRRANTAERYAERIRAEHPVAGQHHDPFRQRTGQTSGERHAARLQLDGAAVDPMQPPPAA